MIAAGGPLLGRAFRFPLAPLARPLSRLPCVLSAAHVSSDCATAALAFPRDVACRLSSSVRSFSASTTAVAPESHCSPQPSSPISADTPAANVGPEAARFATTSQSEGTPVTPANKKLEPLLVVIDLDETLSFSHLNRDIPHDFAITVDKQDIYVSLRPGCLEFLKWCSDRFETGLFTAGTAYHISHILL